MIREIYLSDEIITYELMYTKEKYMKCIIKPNGDICIFVNRKHNEQDIKQFFEDCKEKIIAGIKKTDKSAKNKLAGILTGEITYVLGEEKKIAVKSCDKNYIELSGDELIVCVKNADNYDLKKRLLNQWLKKQCEEIVLGFCQKVYPHFEKRGVRYPKILFRYLKLALGRCYGFRDEIHFNLKLIQYPVEVIEYVVVHEFAHFLEMNHFPEFYEEVAKVMPDWKERENIMNEIARKI